MRHGRYAFLLCALLAWGCDDGDGSGDQQGTEDAGVSPLRVGTYNAGLARGFVDYAEERVGFVAEGLAQVPLDIVCLQEVWEAGDRQAIEAGLAAELPHTYNIAPDAGDCEGAACEEQETADLLACLEPNCGEVPPDMLVGCATDLCADEVNSLSGPCITCISGELGSTIDEIVSSCGPEAGAAGCYAYDGSFGTDIVSRYPIAESDALVFESSLNRRALLYAKTTAPGFGEVHVFCTHLTANLSRIPFPGEGDWPDEQRAQIEQMRAWIDMKAGADGKVVLMGDFNNGPAVDGQARSELPENFALLTAGYDATYASQPDAQCSFCSDNPLVGGVDRSTSELLDHVLLRGFDGHSTQGEIFLDGTTSFMADGMAIESAYSDHYGVKVTIR